MSTGALTMARSERAAAAPRTVAIVGAGIGGLTAALLVAGADTLVTVFEQADDPSEQGAGILLQPNGLAVLDGLGLAARVDALGRHIMRMDVRNSSGRLLVSQEVPDFGDGLDHCVALLRRDLHRTLLEAVSDHPYVTLRTGTRAVAAHRDGTLQLEGAGGRQVVVADLIVGADGVTSMIRGSGRFGACVSNRNTTYVRVLIPTEGAQDFAEHWTKMGATGAAVVAAGITYLYLAAYRPEAAVAVARQDLAAFLTAWRDAPPTVARLLAQVESFDDLIISRVRQVRCRSWVDGRLVLLGDAVHAMAPNAGQGANSAMVDALVLAEELARPQPIPSALKRYQRRRRRKVSRLQNVANRLARFSDLRASPSVAVRDLALRTMTHFPALLELQVRRAQQEPPDILRSTAMRLRTGA